MFGLGFSRTALAVAQVCRSDVACAGLHRGARGMSLAAMTQPPGLVLPGGAGFVISGLLLAIARVCCTPSEAGCAGRAGSAIGRVRR